MKVIAKISADSVLCEVTRHEIALLQGHLHHYDMDKHSMEVGSELQLKKIATTSRFIRSTSKEKLKLLQKELQSLTDGVDEAINTVESLNLFTNLSEEKVFD